MKRLKPIISSDGRCLLNIGCGTRVLVLLAAALFAPQLNIDAVGSRDISFEQISDNIYSAMRMTGKAENWKLWKAL